MGWGGGGGVVKLTDGEGGGANRERVNGGEGGKVNRGLQSEHIRLNIYIFYVKCNIL